jgi:hypothetical protein
MESPIKGKTTVNIGTTMEKHTDIITEILPFHAETSCDTIAYCYMYDMGNGIVLKELRAGSHSFVLSLVDAPMYRSSNRPMRSHGSCHGHSSSKSMFIINNSKETVRSYSNK